MTEGTSANSNADLIKRIEDQARFTRAVVVICTAAVLGVMFVSMTWIFSYLPTLLNASMLSNLQNVVYEWHAIEAQMPKKTPAP